MSFKPFVFTYTPPETVPSQVQAGGTVSNSAISSGVPNPVVADLTTKLSNLKDTSDYLQGLILDQYKNTGITIDPEADPETARALNGCYGEIPPIVTIGMLSNLVDANHALNAIAIASQGSSVQADPYAAANVAQVVNTSIDHLLESNRSQDYQVLAALCLKTDSLMFQSTSDNLALYSSVTPSDTVTDILNSIYSAYSTVYSSLYSALTVANIVNRDISNVLRIAEQATQDLARLEATFTFLKGMILKDKGKSIVKSLAASAEQLLANEVSHALFSLDNLVQRAISPLKGIKGLLGSIISSVKSSINELKAIDGVVHQLKDSGINGMSPSSPCSQAVAKVSVSSSSNDSLSEGLNLIGHYLDLAERVTDQKFANINESFAKITLGRAKGYTDLLELMCSISNIESLVSTVNQLVSSKKSGAIPASGSVDTTSSQVQAVLNNLNTNASVSTSLSVPASVSTVLKDGGLNI